MGEAAWWPMTMAVVGGEVVGEGGGGGGGAFYLVRGEVRAWDYGEISVISVISGDYFVVRSLISRTVCVFYLGLYFFEFD